MIAPVLRLAITATVTTFVARRALEMSHSTTGTEELGCFLVVGKSDDHRQIVHAFGCSLTGRFNIGHHGVLEQENSAV